MEIRLLRGVNDILPDEVKKWQFVEDTARSVFELYGYEEIRTPLIEDAALFIRSIGENTDIVEKQMYAFDDKGGRKISLRPEATASVVRAYLEHAFNKKKGFTKLYYIGPMFRSERPQKGRSRQFHQLGVEAIGCHNPYLDGEVIALIISLLERIGITQSIVKINSLGCRKDKKRIAKVLREGLQKQFAALCEDCQRRFERNIFRILDCKNDKCRKIIHRLPPLSDSLCAECNQHFKTVKAALKILNIECTVDPYLVRGLDYYTRTAFELTHPALGGQDAIGAGGRYDNLISDMNGPELGAIGFALGIERLLIALGISKIKEIAEFSTDVYIATIGRKTYDEAFKFSHLLRKENIASEVDYLGRSLKSQMRAADKSGAKFVVLFGEEEAERGKVTVKNMQSGAQEEIGLDNFIEDMKGKLVEEFLTG